MSWINDLGLAMATIEPERLRVIREECQDSCPSLNQGMLPGSYQRPSIGRREEQGGFG
jgi:hypothetical protein